MKGNLGAALARVRREALNADLKHGRDNERHKTTAHWLPVIDKQRKDVDGALAFGNKAALKKELTQLATAAVLALAQLELEEET